MTGGIEECDFWWFRVSYSILAAFADDPDSTVAIIGEEISIPEDQAEDLGHFRRCILASYPAAADLELMQVAAEFDAIFDRFSRGGAEFNEWFWTNQGFRRHPEWARIRERAKAYLLR